jgi:hypothetical protein
MKSSNFPLIFILGDSSSNSTVKAILVLPSDGLGATEDTETDALSGD